MQPFPKRLERMELPPVWGLDWAQHEVINEDWNDANIRFIPRGTIIIAKDCIWWTKVCPSMDWIHPRVWGAGHQQDRERFYAEYPLIEPFPNPIQNQSTASSYVLFF